ncbi:OLC1v1015297C1 [Oldenlandia corymbosa var. corymbosa]|uniref:OLC1v1015297C1 n=1 Tax=Oldenlandia corymbosa var. corymbosa TaxID=529605 RepID=A0AAV1E6A3_OLDCO|nr:OLC1v1015297C1 [Oldenlandia corymbosa var. corymbosa]
MEEKRTGTPPPAVPAAEPSASDAPSTARRRGGNQKRKASSLSGGNNSAPQSTKRQAREKLPPVPFPPIHNGPLTRARQQPNNSVAAASSPLSSDVKSELEEAALAQAGGGEILSSDQANEVGNEDWEALEARIEADCEAIRSRDSNVHVVPNHAGWFSWTKTHPLEEKMLSSFFNGKSESRTPEIYMEIRNWIMKKFHHNPNAKIELKDLSEITVGESNARQEVMEFLDYWGLINYHPFPETDVSSKSIDGASDEATQAKSLVETLFRFESEQSCVTVAPRSSVSTPSVPTGFFPESSIAEELVKSEGPGVEYHCNSCSADCSRKRYHCQKQADFDLCNECFNSGKFKALTEAFEAVGSLPLPGERLSFADAGNPAMTLAAFLVRLLEPNIATASARSSLKSISSHHSGDRLALRHCFCLEDPPADKKSTCTERVDTEIVAEDTLQSEEQNAEKQEENDAPVVDANHGSNNIDCGSGEGNVQEKGETLSSSGVASADESASTKELNEMANEEPGPIQISESKDPDSPKKVASVAQQKSDDLAMDVEVPPGFEKEPDSTVVSGEPSESTEVPKDKEMLPNLEVNDPAKPEQLKDLIHGKCLIHGEWFEMRSKLIEKGIFEAENSLEVSLRESFEAFEPQLRPPFCLKIPSEEEYVNLNKAILFAILCEPQLAEVHIKHLHGLITDGYAYFTSLVIKVVNDLYPKLVDSVRVQVIWVVKEMVDVLAVGFDGLLMALLRQIIGGDFSEGNLWLCYEMACVFSDDWDCFFEEDDEPLVLSCALYVFLRLLADHCRLSHEAKIEALKRMEIQFCLRMFQEKFGLCLKIGRDLVRLLQDLVHVPEFRGILKDLVLNPAVFQAPGFIDISQLYLTRTSSKYFLLRITPEMENQLRFLLTHVKLGNQLRYQVWFGRKFFGFPGKETILVDIVRFICCCHHPTNDIIGSDIIPRWAVIGWLLKASYQRNYVEANVKLALFYDWLFFDEKFDKIMNIEPAMLLMVRSIPKYIDVTCKLLEFLLIMVENYDVDRKDIILKGVSTALSSLVGKGVVQSLDSLISSDLISPFLKQWFMKMFGNILPPRLSWPSATLATLQNSPQEAEHKTCEGKLAMPVKQR